MTKFEELSEAISKRNKNKKNTSYSTDADKEEEEELEVAGSESSKRPLLSCGDDDIDGSISDDLYRKPRYKPLMGEFAENYSKDVNLIQYFAKPNSSNNFDEISSGMKSLFDYTTNNVKNS
jgi:hypothetical protein